MTAMGSNGMAPHSIGVCLVLIGAVAAGVAIVRSRFLPRIVRLRPAPPVAFVVPVPLALPSRASPAWSQRYLN